MPNAFYVGWAWCTGAPSLCVMLSIDTKGLGAQQGVRRRGTDWCNSGVIVHGCFWIVRDCPTGIEVG